MKKYAYINANLIDCTKDMQIKEKIMVLVHDDRIYKIGYDLDLAEYKIIDLNGSYLMPGLINLHAHLFGTGKPSKVLGGGKKQKAIISFINTFPGHFVADKIVKKNVYNALMSGVTTIRSMGDFCFSDIRVRNKINNGKYIGPRLLVSGKAITCVGGHGDGTFGIGNDIPSELVKIAANNVKNNVDIIKICVTGGVMDAKKKGEPGIVKMSPKQIKAICDYAHGHGLKVASHTESSLGIEVALAGGVDTIEHGSTLNEKTINLFKKNKAAFIVTSSPAYPLAKLSHEITKLDAMATYNTNVVLENMISGAKQALQEGITVGLGTDASCPLVPQTNMYREIMYFHKFYGVSKEFALYTATNVNASILGLDKEIGTIEEGKIADMIVVKNNPLDDLQALSKIEHVVVRGRFIKKCKTKLNKAVENQLDSLN